MLLRNAKLETFKYKIFAKLRNLDVAKNTHLQIVNKTCRENFPVMSSLRGSRPKGREMGKTSVESAREDLAREVREACSPVLIRIN